MQDGTSPRFWGERARCFREIERRKKGGHAVDACVIPPRGPALPLLAPIGEVKGGGSGFLVFPLFPEGVMALLTHPVFQETRG